MAEAKKEEVKMMMVECSKPAVVVMAGHQPLALKKGMNQVQAEKWEMAKSSGQLEVLLKAGVLKEGGKMEAKKEAPKAEEKPKAEKKSK